MFCKFSLPSPDNVFWMNNADISSMWIHGGELVCLGEGGGGETGKGGCKSFLFYMIWNCNIIFFLSFGRVFLSNCIPLSLSVSMLFCPSVRLSVCLSVCLSVESPKLTGCMTWWLQRQMGCYTLCNFMCTYNTIAALYQCACLIDDYIHPSRLIYALPVF